MMSDAGGARVGDFESGLNFRMNISG